MTTSNRLEITELAETQTDRHTVVNEMLAKLEAGACMFGAESVGDNAPPGSPAEGDIYVVGTAGTGAFSGHNEEVAIYYNGAWLFLPALSGMIAYAIDEDAYYYHDSASAWSALNLGGGGGTLVKASVSEVRSAGGTNRAVTADLLESAAAFVALTDAAPTALDWDSGINFTWTIGGNRTLSNPTNGQPGTWRTIEITQDGTGSRILTLGNQYRAPGGTSTIVLSTAAGAIDVLQIYCKTASLFYVFLANGMAA